MPVVRRIFGLIASGASMKSVKHTLEAEGVPTATGGKNWTVQFIKNIILDDVYKSHGPGDIQALVTEGVLSKDVPPPDQPNGIYWFNRNRVKLVHSSQKRREFTPKPRSEWVAIPVPDAGIPREVFDQAQAAIKDNRKATKTNLRFWELSGGVLFCECGRRMMAKTTFNRKPYSKAYHYYVCPAACQDKTCPHTTYHNAKKLEDKVAGYVSELLGDPEKIRRQLDAAIADETGRMRNPGAQEKVWAAKLAETDRKRAKDQEMFRADAITLEELKANQAVLEGEGAQAGRELDRLRNSQQTIADLQGRRDAVLEAFGSGLLNFGIYPLPPPVRREVYDLTRLRIIVGSGGIVRIEGDLSVNIIKKAREEYNRHYREADNDWMRFQSEEEEKRIEDEKKGIAEEENIDGIYPGPSAEDIFVPTNIDTGMS